MNKLFLILSLSVFMISFLRGVDAQSVRIFYADSKGKSAHKDMNWYKDCDEFYAANPTIKRTPTGCMNIPVASTDWCNVAKEDTVAKDCKKAIFSDCPSCRCAADLATKQQRVVTDCIITEAGAIVTLGETTDSLFVPIESASLAKITKPTGKPKGEFQFVSPPSAVPRKSSIPTKSPARPTGKPSGF